MRRVIHVLMCALVVLVSGCAKLPPNISPEGKVALYGEQFMSLVEQAQAQTIALVGQAGVTKTDVIPAIEIFVQIGKGGQDLAAALKSIDESDVTSSQAAAVRARASLTVLQDVLSQVTVRVSSESARTRIAQIVSALKLGAALFDIVQRLAPFLPSAQAESAAMVGIFAPTPDTETSRHLRALAGPASSVYDKKECAA